MKGRLQLIVILVVTVGCLVFVLWGIEFGTVREALGSLRWSLIPILIVLLIGQFLLRVWRFQLLLGPERPTFWRQVVVSAIGFMAINVVPLRMGELARPWLLTRDDIWIGHSLGAVVIERVLDLIMLLVLLFVVAFALALPSNAIVVEGIDILAASRKAIGTLVLIAVVGLAVLGLGGSRAGALIARVRWLGPRVLRFGQAFLGAASSLVLRPTLGLTVLLLSAIIWIAAIAQVYVLLWAFPEVPNTITVATAVMTLTLAGVLTIPTPGFFGPFEIFCKATLLIWAVDPDIAATFAVVWHLHMFAFNVLPGLAFMVNEGLSLSSLVQDSRTKAKIS